MLDKDANLPKYFIRILCSFQDIKVKWQQNQLNGPYNGIDGNPTLFKHINEIIEKNELSL